MKTEDTLKDVMATVLGIVADSINEDTSMDTVEAWDSIKHMNLVLAIEEEFGISIPDEDAANITSYPLIRLVLNEQLKGK
ncbi:MAG: acyl carrier protein [Xanthomonadaceae bacterium]|nr:acyl carrier protein [Xanthomonadaceae bacterium]